MSLAGIHVECGVATVRGNSTIFETIWSETVPYGTQTSQVAPTGLASPGNLVFRIRNSSAGEAYVARGAKDLADPTVTVGTLSGNNARAHFIASELRDLPAQPGQVVKAVAVS